MAPPLEVMHEICNDDSVSHFSTDTEVNMSKILAWFLLSDWEQDKRLWLLLILFLVFSYFIEG